MRVRDENRENEVIGHRYNWYDAQPHFLIRKIHVVFAAVAAITVFIFLHAQGILDGSAVDGVFISSVFVSVCSVIAGSASWVITSAIITRNKSQAITTSAFLAGGLAGFVMSAVLAGWVGPLYGIVLGTIAGTSCCMVFLLKNTKPLDETSVAHVIIRGMVWYATIYMPFSLWQHYEILSSIWS